MCTSFCVCVQKVYAVKEGGRVRERSPGELKSGGGQMYRGRLRRLEPELR